MSSVHQKEKNLYRAKEVCDMLNISKKTLFEWEKEGFIEPIDRDWRQWRVYTQADIRNIRKLIEIKANRHTQTLKR